MRLWQSFNVTSRSVPHGMNSNAFITMLFDTYVSAGAAALAYIGSDFSILPVGWMPATLNYKEFMRNGGWGVIHEFNHHFQKFGCNGNTNEVTNNVMNFIEYIMFTRITEYRDYKNISHGLGLDSHKDIEYLNEYKNDSTSLNTEKGYAILVLNFGPELMLEVFKNQNGVTTVDAFYKALCNTIGLDFTYFFTDIWHLDVSDEIKNEIKEKNYKTYIPIGSYYSSSFSFDEIKNESNHALPYLCNNGLIIDLANDINTIDGFNVEILKVSDLKNGKLINIGNNIYKYETTNKLVDSFTVKVRVFNNEISEDVTITYDLNPINQGIEVNVYKYDSIPYSNIEEAYSNDFIGFSSIETNYQSSQNVASLKTNTIGIVSGKFKIEEDGIYQICYRGGRGSSMLYASINDMNHFEKIGYITINQNNYQLDSASNAYRQMELKNGDVIYYKEYILPTSDNASLELGFTKIENPTASDIKKIPDELFKGFYGDYDFIPNYDIRTDVIKYNDYHYYKKYPYYKLSIASDNFISWNNSDEYSLDKVFDNDDSTYAHSKENITINEDNSIDLVIKSEDLISFNKIIFYGTYKDQVITGFELTLVDNLILITNDYSNLAINNHSSSVLFDNVLTTKEIKLHVYKTEPRYLALSNIDLLITLTYKDN